MRVLVCGGREYGNCEAERIIFANELAKVIGWVAREENESSWLPPGDTVIISGGARGADSLAHDWAVVHWVQFEEYKADWDQYGLSAGPRRNQRMLDEGKPDVVLAFPGGKGTEDMVRRAKAAGVRVVEVPL